jgi:GNAT superfamily N-acetyltransferase
MRILPADTPEDIASARALFREYAASLAVDLCFQGFESELEELPGLYAPPDGRLLIALERGDPAGCVAVRRLEDSVCEMKRLYVRPAFRGRALGKMLAEHVIREASRVGYTIMRLDTLPSMRAAIRLYERLGFVRCPAYYRTPLPNTVFMELALKDIDQPGQG